MRNSSTEPQRYGVRQRTEPSRCTSPSTPPRIAGGRETSALWERIAASQSEEERAVLREEVVLLNMSVARAIASRYRSRGILLDDLQQVACLGLVKAANRFDPSHEKDFLSFAVPTISGEVKRHFRDLGWTVRPPRRIQELQARISSASSRRRPVRRCRRPASRDRGPPRGRRQRGHRGPDLQRVQPDVPGRAARRTGILGLAGRPARLAWQRLRRRRERDRCSARRSARCRSRDLLILRRRFCRRPHAARDRRGDRAQPDAGLPGAGRDPRPAPRAGGADGRRAGPERLGAATTQRGRSDAPGASDPPRSRGGGG